MGNVCPQPHHHTECSNHISHAGTPSHFPNTFLVLDEPTVGLDPIARDGVWTRVRDMQAQFGMTVLLTTHYMEEAEALCDRVALMDHGVLRAAGTPSELKSTVSPDATLEDVFRHYAASDLGDRTPSQNLRKIRSTRKVARRVS
jgi:ABC-2 type transport system ATP-binding protein